MTTLIFICPDELLQRKMQLSMTTEIDDMLAYASAWLQLADEFQSADMPANASYCKAHGEFYQQQAGGSYTRKMTGSFCELIVTGRGQAEA